MRVSLHPSHSVPQPLMLRISRLGPGQHTQYQLTPVPQFTHTIVSVALGQDHTLALTQNGEVLTWGLNRFSQLGYIVDTLSGAVSKAEEPIQATARKVGGLRGKPVRGVAACKTASACWTDEEVYTWGTNNGQLGEFMSACRKLRSDQSCGRLR